MAVFLEWVDDAEPLTAAEIATQARLDDDGTEALSDYLSTVVAPAARQLAEERAGSAIRKARFRDTYRSVPGRTVRLDKGQAYEVVSVSIAGNVVDPATYTLIQGDREQFLEVVSNHLPNSRGPWRNHDHGWPTSGQMVVEYLAGVDLAVFPSVRQWMLLAACWMVEQPSMFTVGEAVQAMPCSYVDSLLGPITVPPRF